MDMERLHAVRNLVLSENRVGSVQPLPINTLLVDIQ